MKYQHISEHTTFFNGAEVNYKVRISNKAKHVQLVINQSGEIQVVVPSALRKFNHFAFINSKSEWLLKHIRKYEDKEYFYNGRKIKLGVEYKLFIKKPEFKFSNDKLIISIPQNNNTNIDELFHTWLYLNASRLLPKRTLEIAARYNFQPAGIVVRKQRTRWGSCSSNGLISLNYKLIQLNQDLVDYVIIHELCHLICLNHSPQFWKTVKSFLPAYSDLRKELRQCRI